VDDLIHATSDSGIVRRVALAVFFKRLNSSSATVDYTLIEKALRWMNPDAGDLTFTHENAPEGLKVSIHGEKVFEISPLAGLPIAVADLSGTGTVGLEWLRDAPLVSVDLSGSSTGAALLDRWQPPVRQLRLVDWRAKYYNSLLNFPGLERITVRASDVGEAQEVLKTMAHPPEIVGE
jgi:hypothetical protein